jgi:hypothetical protein
MCPRYLLLYIGGFVLSNLPHRKTTFACLTDCLTVKSLHRFTRGT